MGALFGVRSWVQMRKEIGLPANARARTGLIDGFTEMGISENWYITVLQGGVINAPAVLPSSGYHSDADLIMARPDFRRRLFRYRGEREWF